MLGTYVEEDFLAGLPIVDTVPEGFTAATDFDSRTAWGGYIHPIKD